MFTKYIFRILNKYEQKYQRLRYFQIKHTPKKPINILFFGTDNFSLPTLKLLFKEQQNEDYIKNLGVVTSFKNPINSVRKFAIINEINCFDWPLDKSQIKLTYDIGIVVSFGHLIPENVIKLFSYGMLNVHASLLPKWRGAAPIIYAIMNGDTETGVSIMKIEAKHFDIGEILAKKHINIDDKILMPDLHKILANEGSELLLNCVRQLPDCLHKAIPQNDQLASYAPKITQSITEIDWNNMNSKQIYNLYRALYSYKPITTYWKNHTTVKFLDVEILPNEPINDLVDNGRSNISSSNNYERRPGHVEYIKNKKYLRIHCYDGSFICVKLLAIEGRKTMTAQDFNNGFIKKVSSPEDRYFSNCK